MDGESFYACGGCSRPVDPEAPGTVAAHRQIETPDASGGNQLIDGEGVYFHSSHYPGDSRHLRRV